jgi:hypothetical protein
MWSPRQRRGAGFPSPYYRRYTRPISGSSKGKRVIFQFVGFETTTVLDRGNDLYRGQDSDPGFDQCCGSGMILSGSDFSGLSGSGSCPLNPAIEVIGKFKMYLHKGDFCKTLKHIFYRISKEIFKDELDHFEEKFAKIIIQIFCQKGYIRILGNYSGY